MGQNLVLNLNDKGFSVCVYNRTVATTHHFLANEAKDTNIVGADTLEQFTTKLQTPRVIFLLVKAGKPVDDFIAKLLPFLTPGDIIIDGGNSEFTDTNVTPYSTK
ncbi:6-phosphogluconate dehydrogenase, decarboxylating-like [Octopus sinensis]|uniref:6-phosphogluconate dehydrogenase, decarboxylating-like n=1 Tax=Octopus sinensis TaxID=2607531 RepID=A0A6P7TTT4_9MOLL|nr:6-phosphogluconate dehydrogenase, decarboxylating-like [Octopus sinensis]